MKQLKIAITIVLFGLLLACGLDRSNPLDPENGDIGIPQLVTGIELSSSGQGANEKYVDISWSMLDQGEADGYFIYRSRSYDGTFDLIKVMYGVDHDYYRDRYKIVPGPYFYKMSSFLYLDPSNPNDNERLEGKLTRPGDSGIVVPQ